MHRLAREGFVAVSRRGALRVTATVWLALLLASCATPGDEPCSVPLAAADAEQRRSLEYVHYAGAGAPPRPTPEERAGLPARLAGADPAEASALHACYGEATDLLVYATRDSDGDGIHDYRVNTAFGKLLEGDLDLDGDGAANVRDAEPYDPAVGGLDENGNGVPDAVDWRLLGRGEAGADAGEAHPAAAYQEALASGYGILLLDRSAEFDAALARSAFDVLTRIFRLPLGGEPGLPALAVIATEEVYLLTAEVDDGTHGVFVPQTRSLTIYRAGLDAPPLVQLGLLTHELAHAYQYSLDFDASDPAAENTRTLHATPTFLSEVAAFGWEAEPLDPAGAPPRTALYTDHDLGVEPEVTYRGLAPEEWLARLDALDAAWGRDALARPELADAGILGGYSLESPWEWHGDQLIAYVFREIEAWIERSAELAPERGELVASMRATSRSAWPGFRYANLADEVRDHLRERFPILDEDLAHLARTYVVAPARAAR